MMMSRKISQRTLPIAQGRDHHLFPFSILRVTGIGSLPPEKSAGSRIEMAITTHDKSRGGMPRTKVSEMSSVIHKQSGLLDTRVIRADPRSTRSGNSRWNRRRLRARQGQKRCQARAVKAQFHAAAPRSSTYVPATALAVVARRNCTSRGPRLQAVARYIAVTESPRHFAMLRL